MADGAVHPALHFKAGDSRMGTFRAKADEDCPSPTRIIIINYQLTIDEMMMWELPSPSFIQIAPNNKDVEEGNDSNLNDSILCNLPEDLSADVIIGTPKEIGEQILCEKFPSMKGCGEEVEALKGQSFGDKVSFKKLAIAAMWISAGIMAFTVLYRNFCGGDSAAMKRLKQQMADLNASNKQKKLPKDAVDASEFLELAGFDSEHVFSTKNPNPIVLAEAQMALQKMLSAVKAK